MRDIEQLLRTVGKTLKTHWGTAQPTAKTNNTFDIVTELDTWAEAEIKGALATQTPTVSFVGEETGGDITASDFWLLDPIDGTGYFVRGMPYCTTMLARITNGTVAEGYIHNFVTDEFFAAKKGSGATKNGMPIHVSTRGIDASFVEVEANTADGTYGTIITSLAQQSIISPKTLLAGHTLTQVAEGKIEARITYKPYGKVYDFAPGALLVQEAGGIVRNIGTIEGTEYDPFNLDFVAGPPGIVATLLTPEGALRALGTQ